MEPFNENKPRDAKHLRECDAETDGKPIEKSADEAKQQDRWENEYRKQLRRLQCPGCGEEELF